MMWVEGIWFGSYAVAVLTVPSVLLNRRGHPVAAVSWLLALFTLPPAALLVWWLFGRRHLQRRRRRRQEASAAITSTLTQSHPHTSMLPKGNHFIPSPTRLPGALRDSVFSPASGNNVRILSSAERVHDYWRQIIETATDHIHALFFTWHDDRTGRTFRDLLAEKAASGCTVRLLYDAVGCNELPKKFFQKMEDNGARVAEFLPVRLLTATPTVNFRNHRKLLIADGRTAYTGGINVTDEYLEWQDLGLAINGPGVQHLQEIFIDDWYFATTEELTGSRYFPRSRSAEDGQYDPSSDDAICVTIASGPDQRLNAMREMVFLAVTECRNRLWVSTPYFIPDEALLLALRSAVYRGVDVRLFLPARSDNALVRRASRAYYPALLDGDIAVFEYDGMLHAKAFLFDTDHVLVGSANLDTRSFRLNFETGTFVASKVANDELASFFEMIQRRSHQIERHEIERHSYFEQLQDAAAHLLSPLL